MPEKNSLFSSFSNGVQDKCLKAGICRPTFETVFPKSLGGEADEPFGNGKIIPVTIPVFGKVANDHFQMHVDRYFRRIGLERKRQGNNRGIAVVQIIRYRRIGPCHPQFPRNDTGFVTVALQVDGAALEAQSPVDTRNEYPGLPTRPSAGIGAAGDKETHLECLIHLVAQLEIDCCKER